MPVSKTLRSRFAALALETRENNWDGERGRAISGTDWKAALDLCALVSALAPERAEPFVSPCGDGSIHVEWNDGSGKVIAEVSADGMLFTERKRERVK